MHAVSSGRRRPAFHFLILGLLSVAVLTAFWPVLGNNFVHFDDPLYVTENARVQEGVSLESLRWALTTYHAANWHPLTWMSHMLDWELFGADAAGHHATSLVLHLANTLLLFLVLHSMTGAAWRSALVAALFGVHPLHVESVAWIAERKDVLSTFFWILTTWAYVLYVRAPHPARLALVGLGLAIGLTAKPMLVTLPFTLLLLDYWPLGRLGAAGGGASVRRLVGEKLPLLVIVAASVVVTFMAQRHGGALTSLEQYSLPIRIENAIVSYATYLGKTFWPRNLAVLYPHPGTGLRLHEAVASAALLALVTVFAVRARRRRPYLLVGWLWYLGTLVPVIGLVQVGQQGMADRFTYVPLIGVFVIVAWLLPSRTVLVPGIAVMVLGAFILRTRAQASTWRDTTVVLKHAISVAEANPIPHMNLGATLAKSQPEEAMAHLRRVLELEPNSPGALSLLGYILDRQGRTDEAIDYHERALRMDPELAPALNYLGLALAKKGRSEEALASFERAVRADPQLAEAFNNLGAVLIGLGRPAAGLPYVERAIWLRPSFAKARANQAVGLVMLGRWAEAWVAVRRARALGTELPDAVMQTLRQAMPEPAGGE